MFLWHLHLEEHVTILNFVKPVSPLCREEGCSRFYAAFHFSGAPSGEIPLKRIKRRTEPTYEFVYGAIFGNVVYTEVIELKKTIY